MYNDEPSDMFNKYWNGNVTSGISKGMRKRIFYISQFVSIQALSIRDNCWRFTGVYAFDKVTGFWLITSIPKFPPPKSKGYAFNMAAVQDGHMALCLTLNSGSVIDLRMYEC